MYVPSPPRRPSFRHLAIGLVVAAGLVFAGPLGAALHSAEQIAFRVLRDGEPFGRHSVVFRREAGDLHVEVDIRLEVKLLFVTVFRYRHTNREVWRDGRLVAIDTRTDDDGERYWLRGRANELGLAVEGSSGSFLAPGDVMPTSYWNPRTVERTQLLDTQRGRLIQVDIRAAEVETVAMSGRRVDARRYRVTGDLTLDLWYTADGAWAKTSFEARGAAVDYARLADMAKLVGSEASVSD
jgi:hypothetical protein